MGMLTVTMIIYQVMFLIILTLIGGMLPLIERKYLSLIQRRVGPKFVGYKGRLQFIADALKMFLKGQLMPRKCNFKVFLVGPMLFLGFMYLLHLNTIWGWNITLIDLEFNLLLIPLINLILEILSFVTGYYSKNKYALMSSLRIVLVVTCGEILFTTLYLVFIFFSSSFSLIPLPHLQEEVPLILGMCNLSGILVLSLLLEVAKSPFDLVEAETELVTGFHTEYGSFYFALFYLGEYLHMFFTSSFMVLAISGFN